MAVGAIIGFVAYEWIFDILIEPYQQLCDNNIGQTLDDNCRLLVTNPLEGFSVRLKVSTYAGIALAMPVILWQLWRFVTPGLYPHEKRFAMPFVASATVLFMARCRHRLLDDAQGARLPHRDRR